MDAITAAFKDFFAYILQGWDLLVNATAGIAPWLRGLGVKEFFDSIVKALGVIQLPF